MSACALYIISRPITSKINGIGCQRGGASLRNVHGTRTGYFYAGDDLDTWTADSVSSSYGVFLVSDGGVTLSSQQNPELNINNPNAPVNNQPPSDLSTPGMMSISALLLWTAFRLRKPFTR